MDGQKCEEEEEEELDENFLTYYKIPRYIEW